MILVLGGNGYVASAFSRLLERRGVDFEVISRAQVNYTRPQPLTKLLLTKSPRIVINAAGMAGKTSIDELENMRDATFRANVLFPKMLAAKCQRFNAKLIQVSSGCVYSGTKPGGGRWTEDDKPNFRGSWYSQTKIALENQLAKLPDTYLCRLRLPFNGTPHPKNLLEKLNRYPRLVNHFNSITHIDEFAEASLFLAQNGARPGIYNIVNDSPVMTEEIVDQLGRAFFTWVDEGEFLRMVKVPRSQCALSNLKLARAGFEMSPTRRALRDSIAEYRAEIAAK